MSKIIRVDTLIACNDINCVLCNFLRNHGDYFKCEMFYCFLEKDGDFVKRCKKCIDATLSEGKNAK